MTTATENNPAATPPEAPPVKKCRVLVVEDDPSARMILDKRLGKSGYEVQVAEDGQAGWEKAQEFLPEIVISDWMMPRMDGRQLCEKLKSDPRFQSVFFILLTAKDRNEDKIAALDTGADEYLVKPCDPHELMARVRAAERVVGLQASLEARNGDLKKAMARVNQELAAVSNIQRGLLPAQFPPFPGYEIAAYYRPSTECSGDYYDVFELGPDRFGVLIADVSGHGTPAMVAMALARTLFHLHAYESSNPGALLERVNHILFNQLPTTQFITAFYAVFDAKSGVIRYSSAGHNPPLLINPEAGTARFLENCEGFPLKLIGSDVQYENQREELKPGEILLLYTDGVPEGYNERLELFEDSRLKAAALEAAGKAPSEIIQNVMDRLLAFTHPNPLHDDASMLIIKRR